MQFKQLLSSRTKLKSRLRIRCLQRLKLPSNDWDLISPGNPFPPTLVPNRWVNSWQPKSGWLLDLLLTTLSRELLYRHYFGKEASYLSDQCFVSTWTSVSMRCWLRGNFQIWLISYTLHTICSVSMLHCVYQWCRRPRVNSLSFALFFYTQHDRRSVLSLLMPRSSTSRNLYSPRRRSLQLHISSFSTSWKIVFCSHAALTVVCSVWFILCPYIAFL